MNRAQVNLWVVAAAASCVLGGTASAQSVVKGTFTLPYEVRWGKAVLPAGAYTIDMESVRGPAVVRNSVGEGRAMLWARSLGRADQDRPTSLLITQGESQRIVRSFNWREGDKVFVYALAPKAERKLAGQNDDSVVVPLVIAGK